MIASGSSRPTGSVSSVRRTDNRGANRGKGRDRTTSRPVRDSQSRMPGPTSNSNSSRKRASAQYCFTLRLEQTCPIHSDKVDIVESLSEFFVVEEYAISVEQGRTGLSSFNHLHGYLRFASKQPYDNVRLCFECLFDVGFDLQYVKSRKSWLTYISKDDMEIYTNLKYSNFSAKFQAYHRAKGNSYSFIKEFDNRHCYKFMQSFYEEVNHVSVFEYELLTPIDLSLYGNWALKLHNYYCEHVTTSWYHKKKHIFLFGPPDSGKTYLINLLLRDASKVVCHVSGTTMHLIQSYHRVIVVNDFREDQYLNLTNWLNLLEGEIFYIYEKYKVPRQFKFDGLVIFTSNVVIKDEALLARLNVIETEKLKERPKVEITSITPWVRTVMEEEETSPLCSTQD